MKTGTGFEFEFDAKRLDDMRLLDELAQTDTDPLAVSRVCLLLLGADDRKRLYDHLKTQDGRVPISDVSREITEILELAGKQGKN